MHESTASWKAWKLIAHQIRKGGEVRVPYCQEEVGAVCGLAACQANPNPNSLGRLTALSCSLAL